MITVEEASSLVEHHAQPLLACDVQLRYALGLVLAEDVASDVDSPPYDKAMVDGYAVWAADLADGSAELTILEEVTAGDVPSRTVESGTAISIMTGAPIPAGADAVVMVEQTEPVEGNAHRSSVMINAAARPGQNILRRGVVMRSGENVLAAGTHIGPAQIGLLAEVGRDTICAFPRQSVAVLSTGNELVPAGERPGPGQIRNSNGPMLCALAAAAGAAPVDLGIVRDDHRHLRERIGEGLQCDVLVLSGGVSAGVLDLVPAVLEELGVNQVFHKVRLKPGKPLWFGVAETPEQPTLVFGLPGNPVSSFVCFELFTRPALRRLGGHAEVNRKVITARLEDEYLQRGDRPVYFPGVLHEAGEVVQFKTLPWQGSADLRTLAAANALAYFPAGERQFAAGEEVPVYKLD